MDKVRKKCLMHLIQADVLLLINESHVVIQSEY